MTTKTKPKKPTGAGKTAPKLALAIIGGRRGYGLRTVTISGKDTILAANDASGKQVALASPWQIIDGALARRRGVDALVVPQYLGTKVEFARAADYVIDGTWTFTKTGRTIPVLVSRSVAAQCTGPNREYSKRDVVPLLRVLRGTVVPWQGECDSNGSNAHERGRLTLKKGEV